LRLDRSLLLIVAALTACAAPAPKPPADPPAQVVSEPPPEPPAYAPPKFVLSPLPFPPAFSAELEALPPPTADLWDRIVQGYAIPDIEGPVVDKWERYYAERPDYVARIVERSRRYLYHIVREVDGRGMPLEIALLPMVESAFNPTALSSARAAGIWQFIPSTGNHFGLKQTWWFDSRRDVVAATDSALDYLQKLYDEFADWQLALAAYNWGEGNVRRAIARNRAKGLPADYSSLTNVPAETQNYVPKLQAVKNIVADPERYNLTLSDVPDAPYFAIVHTSKQMDVKHAADLAEMGLEDFLALNPQHNRPVIAGADEHTILLPIDNAELFAAKLELIDQPLVSWQAYRLKPRETLPEVAAKYAISTETLRAINGIGPRARVPVGHMLLVPSQRPSYESADSLTKAVFTVVPAGRTLYYTVRRGDSLSRIAKRYRVSPADLRQWNNLTHNRVTTGQKLRVLSDAPPPARRKIRRVTARNNGKAAPVTNGRPTASAGRDSGG
jgi:membrane-bound lytic murein transglycosylase D